MDENKELDIADAILEKPFNFEVNGSQMYLYPQTLGKRYLLARLVAGLEIDELALRTSPTMEALRVAKLHQDNVCRIIAYSSFRKKNEVFNEDKVRKRIKFFKKHLDEEDLATLLMYILQENEGKDLIHELGIDQEQRRLARVQSAKQSSNTCTFGGKTLYGSLIDVACERYGWTMDYVVWGISFQNLQLLLADFVKSIYLTDEERRTCGVSSDQVIDASDPRFIDFIKSKNWD